jgi:hypothetical protein
MNKLTKQLKSGLFNLAWIAARLYPDKPPVAATAKLHNKVHGVQNRSLSETELKSIKEIIK